MSHFSKPLIKHVPKPRLTEETIDSIDKLVNDLPAAYLGTDRELAIRYLQWMVQDYHGPAKTAQRERARARAARHRAKP